LDRHSCYMPIIHLEFKPALSGGAVPANRHSSKERCDERGVDRRRTLAPKRLPLPGPMAEWLRRGPQILLLWRVFATVSDLRLSFRSSHFKGLSASQLSQQLYFTPSGPTVHQHRDDRDPLLS
jgi:hypothetical protein